MPSKYQVRVEYLKSSNSYKVSLINLDGTVADSEEFSSLGDQLCVVYQSAWLLYGLNVIN